MESPVQDAKGCPAGLPVTELQERIIYALLLPAVRVARVFDVPLREIGDSLHMAYFHELRDMGFKMREAAATLDVSMRKVATLSRRLKENFLSPEREVGLPRRIEFLLWAEPLSRVRIKQALPTIPSKEIDAALNQLVATGRLVQRRRRRTEVYERSNPDARLVSEDWQARIDGLNNLLGNVCHAVYGRFFADEPRAFARTLTFQVREKDIPVLHDVYQEIFERIQKLEEAARDASDAVSLDLSLCWAPYQFLHENHESEKADDET